VISERWAVSSGRTRGFALGLISGLQTRAPEVVKEGEFGLPEGVAAVLDFGEVVEGTRGGEEAPLFVVGTDAAEEVGEGFEGVIITFGDDALGGGFFEAFETVETEAEIRQGSRVF